MYAYFAVCCSPGCLQLMDMGFSLDQAIDALMNASSLEQATDYILSHAPLLSSSSGASRVCHNCFVQQTSKKNNLHLEMALL